LISNLHITGGNLSIAGDVRLNAKGEVLAADFPKVVLDDENRFKMKLRRKDGVALASVSGAAFDARNLIIGMFKQDADGGAGKKNVSPLPVNVEAQFARVYANRGEVLTDVKGSLTVVKNTVQQADIHGTFLSGAPATIKISPAGEQRDMRVVIGDAGAALRAANIYSKASGGQLELSAQLGNTDDPSIRRGMLVIRNFAVRDETALREIERSDRTTSATTKAPAGPRNQGFTFTRLTVPFSSDQTFVRIGDSLLKGPEMGATVQGVIRKRDGAIDIGGTIIPAYSLNSALGEVPLLGDILTGGKGQGVFGLTFALRGTMQKPQFIVNPVSALAPGFLRRIFEIGGNYPEPGQKKSRPPAERTN
jgi:AsmA-like protein